MLVAVSKSRLSGRTPKRLVRTLKLAIMGARSRQRVAGRNAHSRGEHDRNDGRGDRLDLLFAGDDIKDVAPSELCGGQGRRSGDDRRLFGEDCRIEIDPHFPR